MPGRSNTARVRSKAITTRDPNKEVETVATTRATGLKASRRRKPRRHRQYRPSHRVALAKAPRTE